MAGILLALAGWLDVRGLPVLISLQMLYLFGCAFLIPQATAGALTPFPRIAGTASALVGFLQMTAGLIANALSSIFYDGTERPLVVLNIIWAGLALAAYLGLVRRARPPSPEPC